MIEPLTNPAVRPRRRRLPRGVPVAARIRLLRQAHPHRVGRREDRRGLGDADGRPRLRPLRRPGRRLGRGRHHADRPKPRPLRGHPSEHADRQAHGRSLANPTEEEQTALAALAEHRKWGTGYSKQQSTRPQTLGYGLVDSPVGQLAWIVEKFWAWADCDGHPENALSRDELLDNVMVYWVTGTAASSARLYWESFQVWRGRRSRRIAHRRSRFPRGAAEGTAELVRAGLQHHPLDGHAARRALRRVRTTGAVRRGPARVLRHRRADRWSPGWREELQAMPSGSRKLSPDPYGASTIRRARCPARRAGRPSSPARRGWRSRSRRGPGRRGAR